MHFFPDRLKIVAKLLWDEVHDQMKRGRALSYQKLSRQESAGEVNLTIARSAQRSCQCIGFDTSVKIGWTRCQILVTLRSELLVTSDQGLKGSGSRDMHLVFITPRSSASWKCVAQSLIGVFKALKNRRRPRGIAR